MKKVQLWGYTIYEDGTIIGLKGKKINYNKQIKIKWGKQKQNRLVYYARFVYYAFNYKNFNFNDNQIVVQHINGINEDCRLENLIAKKRKYVNQGEYNKLSKLTDKQVEEIKYLYKNTDTSYRILAKEFGVSHTLIKSIVDGTHRNKENYIMK